MLLYTGPICVIRFAVKSSNLLIFFITRNIFIVEHHLIGMTENLYRLEPNMLFFSYYAFEQFHIASNKLEITLELCSEIWSIRKL